MLREELKAVFITTCYKVYPPDGWDPIDEKYQGIIVHDKKNKIENTNIKKLFLRKPKTQFILIATSFLGLPNTLFRKINDRENYKKLSWLDIGKNLLGWNNNTNIALNIIKAPFFFAWHAFWILPKLAINIAKIFTEFLPQFATTLCEEAAISIKKNDKKLDNLSNKFLYGLAKFGQIFFESWAFIGRAITSPINASRKAWKMGGYLLGKDKSGKDKYPLASKILGGVLATLSIGITAAVYAVLFPLAIHAIGVAIAQQVPVITHAISSAIQFLSPISFISQTLMPMITTYAAPALVSACLIAGAAVPIVGVIAEKCIKLLSTQSSLENKKVEKKVEENIGGSTNLLVKNLNMQNPNSTSSSVSSGEEPTLPTQNKNTEPLIKIVSHGPNTSPLSEPNLSKNMEI